MSLRFKKIPLFLCTFPVSLLKHVEILFYADRTMLNNIKIGIFPSFIIFTVIFFSSFKRDKIKDKRD